MHPEQAASAIRRRTGSSDRAVMCCYLLSPMLHVQAGTPCSTCAQPHLSCHVSWLNVLAPLLVVIEAAVEELGAEPQVRACILIRLEDLVAALPCHLDGLSTLYGTWEHGGVLGSNAQG